MNSLKNVTWRFEILRNASKGPTISRACSYFLSLPRAGESLLFKYVWLLSSPEYLRKIRICWKYVFLLELSYTDMHP